MEIHKTKDTNYFYEVMKRFFQTNYSVNIKDWRRTNNE